MSEIIIRDMEVEDIDHVYEVEKASFNIPWPKDIFYQELINNSHAYYAVVELDKKIIGYAGMWIVLDDAQVTNIAILPDYRGKKYGESLFQYIFQRAVHLGVKRFSLEVRVSNHVAQQMYRKFGLVPGGIRKQYYTDNMEDAIIMWVNL